MPTTRLTSDLEAEVDMRNDHPVMEALAASPIGKLPPELVHRIITESAQTSCSQVILLATCCKAFNQICIPIIYRCIIIQDTTPQLHQSEESNPYGSMCIILRSNPDYAKYTRTLVIGKATEAASFYRLLALVPNLNRLVLRVYPFTSRVQQTCISGGIGIPEVVCLNGFLPRSGLDYRNLQTLYLSSWTAIHLLPLSVCMCLRHLIVCYGSMPQISDAAGKLRSVAGYPCIKSIMVMLQWRDLEQTFNQFPWLRDAPFSVVYRPVGLQKGQERSFGDGKVAV